MPKKIENNDNVESHFNENYIENFNNKINIGNSIILNLQNKKNFIEEYSDSTVKPFDKVKHLLGVAESGVPDLGQRHRKHLIRKIKGDAK